MNINFYTILSVLLSCQVSKIHSTRDPTQNFGRCRCPSTFMVKVPTERGLHGRKRARRASKKKERTSRKRNGREEPSRPISSHNHRRHLSAHCRADVPAAPAPAHSGLKARLLPHPHPHPIPSLRPLSEGSTSKSQAAVGLRATLRSAPLPT